jgi:ATP-binding cassette, subfamily G (WHITE), member 2, PDR
MGEKSQPSQPSSLNIPAHDDGKSSMTLPMDYAEEQESQMNADVLQLARKYTSNAHGADGTLFPLTKDSPLDPSSRGFNTRKWLKAFYDLWVQVSEGNRPRTSGVAFKKLDVYGFGTPTDFQKSVGNVYVEGFNMVKGILDSSNTQ